MSKLTHIKDDGTPTMVDVSSKAVQLRTAEAIGFIKLAPETLEALRKNQTPKGNVLVTAQIAGITAAKKTSDLIPLCHPLMLSKIDVTPEITDSGVAVKSTVKCSGKTGVEMEALTSVSVTLLTIYDMLKAIDKNMIITETKLLSKTKEDMDAR